MKDKVVIVWGGNQSLALRVEKNLRKVKYEAEIGGGSVKDTYIGNQVITQLNNADKVVVLVQGGPVTSRSNNVQLRPNLMYEWGYANAIFSPDEVKVFMIGLTENDLPSDLKGSWVHLIEPDTIEVMAQKIAEEFMNQEKAVEMEYCNIFNYWPENQKYLQEILSGKVNYNNLRLANILLHSIQPAYYHDGISFLKNFINELKTPKSKDLKEAMITINGICEFYEKTQNQLAEYTMEDLRDIRNQLEIEPEIHDRNLGMWVNIFRYDFIGLCHMLAAELYNNELMRNRYIKQASDAFAYSINLFDVMSVKAENQDYVYLWRGYIYRNYGKMLSELGQIEEGINILIEAQMYRKRALAAFKRMKSNSLLVTHLELEAALVEIDLLKFGNEDNDFAIIETLESLKRFNRPFDLWKMAILETKAASLKVKDETILFEIDSLYKLIHK